MGNKRRLSSTSSTSHLQHQPSLMMPLRIILLTTSLVAMILQWHAVSAFSLLSNTHAHPHPHPQHQHHHRAYQRVAAASRRRSSSTTSSTRSRLFADLKFSGDSRAVLELEAPAEHVLEWLHTPNASDFRLLGTNNARQVDHKDHGLIWECPQPRIDFMGLDLQPTFVHKLERIQKNKPQQNKTNQQQQQQQQRHHQYDYSVVVVQVVDSRTDIFPSKNPANQVVGSLMERAKFKGKSVIQVLTTSSSTTTTSSSSPTTTTTSTTTTTTTSSSTSSSSSSSTNNGGSSSSCRLLVDLTLTLHVPLPPLVLLPPGFNAIGSSIVQRTGKSRTEQLLKDLKVAYFEWAATSTSTSTSTTTSTDTNNATTQSGTSSVVAEKE